MLRRYIDRTVSVSMVLLVLIVLGIVAITRLPVSLIPDVDIPYVTVRINAPDYSAREINNSIVKPLHRSLVQINHLKSINSSARDGSATITLTLEEGHDSDLLFIEVNEKIDRSMSSLPSIERPYVFKAGATDIPAFYLTISLRDGGTAADTRFLELSDFSRDVIAKRLEQLDEVAMVDISGAIDREILVVPDRRKLEMLGITMSDFESSISAANIPLSNLSIRDGEYHYNVRFRNFASTAEDIADVWFNAGGRILQIKDVASVTEKPAERSGLVRSDGRDAVVFAVIKQSEARMSDLRRSVAEQTEVFETEYPQLQFTLSRDQTELLEYSINNLIVNIVMAIALVCVVIFLFMRDFRSPMLVALAIPVSLVIAFFVLNMIGVTINLISLSGLLLGVGMMVDNSIILVDNITGRWTRGEDLRTSVIEGTGEVSGAMLSSVLTTCAVFIPLVFMNGLAGELFFDQALSISVVLLVAHAVTVAVIPVYYLAVYRKLPAFKPSKWLEKLNFRGGMRLYDKTVSWFLARKGWISWSFPLASALVIGVSLQFMEKEKLPPVTYTDTVLNLDWNDLITLEENQRRIADLESCIEGLITQVLSMVGTQQFVLSHSGDQTLNQANIYFKCPDAKTLEKAKSLLQDKIRSEYPAASLGFSNSGNIFEMVFAENEPQLVARLRPTEDTGLQVEPVVDAVRSIRAAHPDWHIDEVNLKEDVLYISEPELLALYGVSFSQLANVMENALNGNTVFDIVQGNRSVPVILGTGSSQLRDLLADSFVETSAEDGELVRIPVNALMRETFEQDFKELQSGEDGDYYPVRLDIPGSEVPAAMASIDEVIRPAGKFEPAYSGAWFSNRELVKEMSLVLAVALMLLFLILASQFESLVQPLIILSEVVIDIAFSLLVLWICGVSINIMSLIGLVVTSGIVINDSILKVDTINRLVKGGLAVDAAVHEAGHKRLKAILMTSITTILSVAPFLSRGSMGDDLQYPMALVITVGMTIGTLVSLFYVPTVYSSIYRKR